MRRLSALAAALTLVAGSLAAGTAATAKDHGQHGEQRGGEPRGGDGRWNGGRGGPPMAWPGGGNGRWERGGPPGGGNGRWERAPDARYEQRYDPRYDAPYEPRSYPTPRRGGFLGPGGGAPIEDPGRYRLRSAPRGYQWVRVPGGMALVSQATGQVFDVVPY